MIKFLREKIKNRKYLLLLKRYTEPSKEFSNKSRGLFISELKKRGVIAPVREGARLLPFKRALGYGFASLFVLSSFTGGAAVYAQKQSVDFNHPLYPLKRLGENIRVKLAPPEEKPALQDEFAQRRLTEIKELISKKEEEINLINSQKTEEAKQAMEKINQKTGQATTEDAEIIRQAEEQKKQALEQIAQEREKEIEKIESENKSKTEELNNDFHETIDSVLKTIDHPKEESSGQKKAENLCESLRKKIKEHEEVLQEKDDWTNFEKKCAEIKEND